MAASRCGVTAILLPVKSRPTAEAETRKWLKNRLRRGVESDPDGLLLEKAKRQLTDFLRGHRRNLDLPLDLSSGRRFVPRVARCSAHTLWPCAIVPVGRGTCRRSAVCPGGGSCAMTI